MPIADNLARVRDSIAEAAQRAGRDLAEIELMAVSKVHPVELLREAYAAGQRLFGENRVQEWQEKHALTRDLPGLRTHLIGPLQSNKVNRAAALFHAVDTLDSAALAVRLDRAARAAGYGPLCRLPVLLEVKLSDEATKHGCAPAELPALLDALAPLDALRPVGLMTVPPWPDDLARADELARPVFARLRALREQSVAACPTLTQLSMGMSNDFRAAIAEGSTCVRIGTAIFGARPRPA